MYRRPKFLEILLEIRQEMALEADYDVVQFVQSARNGESPGDLKDLTGPEVPATGEADKARSEIRKRGQLLRKT